MRGQHVLVIGPPRQAAVVVDALRDRGVTAWSDRIGRAALDFVSFDWADALVVVDTSEHLESRNLRPVKDFDGPKVLVSSAPLSGEDRAALIDGGFDSVFPWPSPTEVIAAMVHRTLDRSVRVDLERASG